MVEARGFEPLSEKLSFQLSTSVAFYLILSLAGAKKHAPVRDSPVLRDEIRGIFRARSPLNDALIRAAILSVRTAAALRQRLKQYYCRYLFYNVEAFIEVPRLCSLIETQIPRRNPFAPDSYSEIPLRDFRVRSIFRLASRSAAASRLSYSFLPLHSPTSSFALPFTK